MARRSRASSAPSDRVTAKNSPFKALSALKGRGGHASSATPATPRKPGQEPPAEAAPPAAEDLALFRRTLANVAPLATGNRAEIDAPRPAPVPRPKSRDTEAEVKPERQSADPLLSAYADVTPMADSGRVELSPSRRRRRIDAPMPEQADKTAHADGELPPIVLPADADLSDPTTLFQLAARGVQRVGSGNRVELAPAAPAPTPLKREADERDALEESLTAPLTFEDRLDMGDEAAFLRPGLPRRVLTDLRRGRWVLQGELDLHGLVRDQARDALAHFLAQSLQQGRRCVRVIHGKGLGSPGRVSILKQLSRGWLAQREEILAFCQAGPHDGGGGALLVLLRAPNNARR